MPLRRYEIRNEYSLADPELYRAADKDDPEALLEGVAMAGLVGVLRQLGDLAEFAAELFHDLHEDVMATAARGHGLMTRLQQVEAEVPSIEKAFLSQTSHSMYLQNAGIDWHPNLRMDQNLVTRGDLPRFVMDSYEECRGPPRLFLLDKFDIAGAGACLKRYTDPSIFKVETTETAIQREKKARKIKRKASHGRNGETPEVIPTSHPKLHQLLSEERTHTEKPTHHVKLKRRQSSCSLIDSTNGKSYMERFLATGSPESKFPYESSASPLRLTMEPSNSGELSPENKLGERDRGPPPSPSKLDKLPEQSFDELGEDIIEEGILKFPEPTPDIKLQNIPSSLDKVEDQKGTVVDEDSKTEGYRSEDITSEMDNYVDALAMMEPEMETDIERRQNESGYCNIKMKVEDNTNEETQKLQAQLSNSNSTGSSIASDDGDSSFRKERFSLSYSHSPSNLTENVPSDGDGAAKVHPSAEILPAEIVDMCLGKHSDNEDVGKPRSPERVVRAGTCRQVSDSNYTSEYGKASSDSSPANSNDTVSHLSSGESDSKFQLAGPELASVSSSFPEDDTIGSSPNAEDYGKSSGGELPWLSNSSDIPSQLRDNMLHLKPQSVETFGDGNPDDSCNGALMQTSNNLDLNCENKDDDDDGSSQEMLPTKTTEYISIGNQLNGEHHIPESVVLPTETQCFQEQDLETCSATTPIECQPDALNPGQWDDVNLNCIGAEPVTVIPSTGEKSEDLTSTVNALEAGGFSELKLLKTTDEVPPAELESASVGIDCSEVETSNSNLEVSSNKSDCDVEDRIQADKVHLSCSKSSDTEENSDPHLDFPSNCRLDTPESASMVEVDSQLAHLPSGSISEEAVDENLLMGHTGLGSSSGDNLTLQNECNSNGASDQDKLETTEASIERHLIGSGTRPTWSLLYPSDSTTGLLPLSKSDQESVPEGPEQHPQSHLSHSEEETTRSAIHSLQDLEVLSDKGLEVTSDQLDMNSLHEEQECIALSKSESEQEQSPNHVDRDGYNNTSKYTSMDPLDQLSPATTEKEGQQDFPASEEEFAEPVNTFVPLLITDDEKPQQGTQMLEGELMQPHYNPFSTLSTLEQEKIQQDILAIEGKTALPQNPFLPLPAREDEKPEHGSLTSGVEMQPSLVQPSQCASSTAGDEVAQPLNSSKPIPIRDDEMPQKFYIPLQGLVVHPPPKSITRPPSTEDDNPKHDSLNLEEEMTSAEDGKPNGIIRTRIPRPRDPLIDAVALHVASHDKSMLRKVSERVRPELAPKVDERNSLLEQIRNKSFNLKPAVATRPSIHGPRTNLKVVAILEKANAIRQALAGSDDDDDDDSWSDS